MHFVCSGRILLRNSVLCLQSKANLPCLSIDRPVLIKVNGGRFVSRWLAGQPYLTNSGVDDGAPNSLPQFPISIPSGREFQRDLNDVANGCFAGYTADKKYGSSGSIIKKNDIITKNFWCARLSKLHLKSTAPSATRHYGRFCAAARWLQSPV